MKDFVRYAAIGSELREWAKVMGRNDPATVRIGVAVEVGRFRFTSTQGLPRGLVRSVLETRRRKAKPTRGPKPAELLTLTGPRSYGRAGLEQRATAQRNAYQAAMASGRWAA